MATHLHLTNGDTATVARNHRIRISARLLNLGKFLMAYSHALDKIGKEAPHASATLLRLLARVESENQLYFHSVDLAKELSIPRSTLEDHFAQLRGIGAIVPDPKQEHRTRGIVLWRVCPYLVWIGTGEAMRAYLQTLPPNHPFLQWAMTADD